MNNTLPFLPIELQNIIISYSRPVYPYIRELKINIRIFNAKNEKYKLEHKEESGLTFNNYYFNNYYNDLIRNIENNYYIEEIEDMGSNFMDTIFYEYLDDEGYIEDEDDDETNFLTFFFLMINYNTNNHIDFREFTNDFEDRYSVSDSDSDSEIYIYSDTG